MIYDSNTLSQPVLSGVLGRRTAAKAGVESAADPAARQPASKSISTSEVEHDSASRPEGVPVAPSAPATPLRPIADRQQAAEVTQHARLAILAQPRLAILAQANSSSQSVQRLLS